MAFLDEAAAFFDQLPQPVAWAADPGLTRQTPGPASEARACARASTKRLREFRSGRNLARQVLADLGAPTPALPVAPDRTPVWPRGIRGSITHCDDLAIAVAARGLPGLGVDVEPARPLPPEVARHIMTGADLEMPCETAGVWAQVPAPTLIFCAKEAFYKATSHRLPFVPDFNEAAIRPCGPNGFEMLFLSQRLRACADQLQIAGHWCRAGGYVVTLAVSRPPKSAAPAWAGSPAP